MSKDFNWVEERSKCSIAMEFAELKRQAKKDAEFRNGQLSEKIGIEWQNSKADSFSIRRHREGTDEASVLFFLEGDHILVTDQAANCEFKLTVDLNDDGECRFRIDGAGEYKRWQVLKKALGRLFFEAK